MSGYDRGSFQQGCFKGTPRASGLACTLNLQYPKAD